MIGRDMGWTDLSWNVFSGKSYLFNTTIDRYWLDLNFNKFQARIGRQRINWGQSLVWNPNDIFNAYSFFDFDYIERPGSDAARLQYYPSFSSAIELAVKSDSNKDITAAALYRFNKWGYDIQFLAAYVNSEDLMAGMGWSGAAGKTSFRGELSWFQPSGSLSDSSGTGLFTIGFDRVFVNNSMAQVQFMYCNNPLDLSDFGTFYSGNMSAKDLAFSKFSAFGSFSWAATPLINFGFSSMWFPGLRGFFAGPTTDFSLTDNFDFSLIWQHFRADRIGSSRLRLNLLFLRIKYSF
jgi:hypothetical protein